MRAVNAEGNGEWAGPEEGVPGHPNRAPAFPSGSVTLDVDENTASGADIDDSPAATDLDGDSLTYSLGGTGSAHFAIVAGSGQLQTKGALDHEKKASYSVVVTASDGTLTDTIAVTIEVNDLNEAPSFDDGASASVNAAENQTAVATPEVTDPEKDDLTYRLDTAAAFTDPGVSNDHASFTMTGAGVLTFNAAPDFEAARNTYTLVIEVRDSKDGAGKADTDWDDAVTLTVNVTDVAEPPDAPADLAVSSTANGLTVTWTAPVMTGKPPLTGYDVEQRLRTSAAGAVTPVWGAWTDALHTGTAASASITGLTPEATYQVRVRGVNAEGNGEWAGPEEGVPEQPNRAPAFPSDSVTLDVDENTAPGADIDDSPAATDLDGDSLTYSLGGTGSAHFDIVAGSGQLQTKGALDHEKKASYSVVVTASDGTLTDTIAVTIEVNDLNEAPSFDDGASASVNAAENQTAVATPEVTDPEKDDLTYRLDTAAAFTDPGVSNDHASFTMTGAGVLTFNAAPDFEAARNTYTLVIEVRDSKDGAGKADTDWDDAVTLTVNVTDVAEPPDAPADLAVSSTANGLTVTWTAPVMTGKPPLTGYDVEQRLRTSAAGAVTPVWGAWTDASHTGTAASASITGLTPEATYQVRVRAVNAEGNGEWAGPEEGVPGHPNRAPAFPSDSVTLDVDENTASGTAIGDAGSALTATDLDGDSLTYSLGGTGSAHFAIVAGSGQLQTKGALDHEKKASYSVVVTASDGTLTDTIAVTINVNDLNEAPSFDAGASASVNAAENQTAVATPDATDPEKDDLTYRLDTAAAFSDPAVSNDHASFTMTDAGVLTFKAAPDFEAARNNYTLVIEVRDSKDGAGKADTDWDDAVTLTVNVTDVAEPPDAPADLAVSSTANGLTVTWTAPVMTGKPPLTGYDVEQRLRTSAAGAVTPVWGAWTDASHTGTAASASITGLTPEAVYQVRVRAVNAEGNGEWAGPEEGVPGHPNRAPAFPSDSVTLDVDENTASGTAIGDAGSALTATDLDGDSLTYSLGGTGSAHFAIVAGSGQLQTKGALDHEKKASYSVVVTASDGTLTDTIAVTIEVNDLNEAPSFDDGETASVNAAENQTAVATPEVTDPEKDDLTYRLDTAAAFTDPAVSNDHASFTMTGAGVLTFNAAPDFEAARNTYTLVIEVRDSKDGAGKADTDWDDAVTLTVNVTDVAEPPDAPADLAVSSTANGLTVTWTAPVMTGKPPLDGYDVEQRLRTSAAGAVTPVWGSWTDASHTGTAASSSITGLTPEAVYQVRVRAVNDEGESGWTSASGAPGHPNRAPAFPSGSVTLDVDENTASGADIDDSPAATDLDGDSLTYSLGGTGSAHFAIVAGSGQLQTKGALDHEKKASYSVVVTASDGTLTDTIAVTIEVNDLNEAPSFDDGASASVNAAGEPDGGGHAGGDRPGEGRSHLPAGHGGGLHRSRGLQRPRFVHHDRRRSPDLQRGPGLRGGQEHLHPGHRGKGQQGRRGQGRHGLGRRRHPDGQRHRRGRAAGRARRSGGEFHGQRADGDLDGAGDDGEAAADGLRRGAAAAHQRRRRRHPGLGGVDRRVPHRHGGQRQHHRADAGGDLPGAGAGGQRRGERGVGRAGGRGAGPPQPGAGLPQRQRDAGRGREHGIGAQTSTTRRRPRTWTGTP